ncbi:MAG: hypothetical protein Q8R17_01950 [bacterium]|nr:hypothetical protein [bacterium]
MNIQELKEKINSSDVFFSAVVVLVGFASFGLGRLSKLEDTREPVRIENTLVEKTPALAAVALAAPAQSSPMQAGGQIIASKTGSKYHYPWCAGASQISEKNKRLFASVEEARKAGYTPASNCKGLK